MLSPIFSQKFTLCFGALMRSFLYLQHQNTNQPIFSRVCSLLAAFFSMVVLSNSRITKEQSRVYAAAPVAPNVLNYALPSGYSLSMGVVVNVNNNKSQAAADAAAPTAPNFLNDVLPDGNFLPIVVVENTKLN